MRMEKTLAAALAALLALSPVAASAQTLEELSDLKAVHAALKEQPSARLVPVALPQPAPAQAAPALPSHFRIDEKIISLTNSFTLHDDAKRKIGDITEKFFSWTRTFTYKDAGGGVAAVAHEKFFSWGTQIVVEDAAGRKLGTIKENVFKSLFKVYTSYSILDASDREVAVSEKSDWITTDFRIHDKSGRLVAHMHRGWLNILSDHWDVDLADQKALDSRVVVMIAAYKTAVDNERRAQESSKHDDK